MPGEDDFMETGNDASAAAAEQESSGPWPQNQPPNNEPQLDHSACQQQIVNLQADLELEQKNAVCFTKTIKDLRDTIESLRDQLSKHGIGNSLEARLRQLGFISGLNSDVGSSASSVSDSS